MQNIKFFIFILSICVFFTFPQIASAQWPSDLESGSGSGQQIQQPRQTVNTPKPTTPKKAVQKGMIPKSVFGMNFQFPASWIVNDEAAQSPILFLSFLPLADDNSHNLQVFLDCRVFSFM